MNNEFFEYIRSITIDTKIGNDKVPLYTVTIIRGSYVNEIKGSISDIALQSLYNWRHLQGDYNNTYGMLGSSYKSLDAEGLYQEEFFFGEYV